MGNGYSKGVMGLLTFLVVLVALCVLFQIYRIQNWAREDIEGRVVPRWKGFSNPLSRRGLILDRNGLILADNRYVADLLVEKEKARDLKLTAEQINYILSDSTSDVDNTPGADELLRLLEDNSESWKPVLRSISADAAGRIESLHLPGVYLKYRYERFYPHGSLAAHILGFAGRYVDARGGLEFEFEKSLAGSDGLTRFSKDKDGNPIPGTIKVEREPTNGLDLVLTLDRNIQVIVEEELQKGYRSSRAEWALAAVMDPNSGDILASAFFPSFDPNSYSKGRVGESYSNPLVAFAVEPGSVLKPIIMATALDSGLSPAEKFNCHPTLKVGIHTIREAIDHPPEAYGWLDLTNIISKSSNIGMAQIALRTGQDVLYKGLLRFGLFRKYDIGIPGESAGTPPAKWMSRGAYRKGRVPRWPQVTLANVGFGQGLQVTPLQLLTAYSALANGGELLEPRLVINTTHRKDGFAYASNTVFDEPDVVIKGRATNKNTAARLTAMMERVVTDGTGKSAKVGDVRVSGKTGTAQVAGPGGQYVKGHYLASFAGYFPAKDPQVVVLVMVYKPRGLYYGGKVAAPIFQRIASRLALVLRIVDGSYEKSKKIEKVKRG